MTTIEDTLTYIDGSKANGRLVVGWKPFTVGNVNAAGGELEWQIVEGAVLISLYANTGAQPTGSYYVVKYELENGAVYLEQWIVPDLPTVNLGQVRVAFPPSPSVMISPLQLTSLGAAPGMFLMWNGQRWVPGYPGTFSFVDPTLVKGDMIVRGEVAPATRLGVGLDGWTLIADSSAALGIKWVAPVSGFADPMTTKGDLIVRSSTVTTRIGVGSDGWVLTADSTLLLGVKWAAAPVSLPAGSTGYVQWNNAGVFGASANLFWDNSNARLGIGTTSPQALLEVYRSPTGEVMRLSIGAGSGNEGPAIGFYDAANQASAQIASSKQGASTGDLVFRPATSGVFNERMRITAAGNVGIGTTGPQNIFHVRGAANQNIGLRSYNGRASIGAFNDAGSTGVPLGFDATQFDFTGGNVGIGTTGPTTILSLGANLAPIKLAVYDGGVGNCYGLGVISGSLCFGASLNAASGTPQMYLTAAGNVGIGLGPTYKLDVAGDVNCSGGVFRVGGVPIAAVITRDLAPAALNSVYQNSTGKPMFVNVTVSVVAGQYMQFLTDAGNPPTNIACVASNGAGVSETLTVSAWVMPGHFYKVFNSSGSSTLVNWVQWY